MPGQRKHADFVAGISSDKQKVEGCTSQGGLQFDRPLKGVYHYRKHGEEFFNILKQNGNTVETYLGETKHDVFQPHNHRETIKLPVSGKLKVADQESRVGNSFLSHRTASPGKSTSGARTNSASLPRPPRGSKISTMFVKCGEYAKFRELFLGPGAGAPGIPVHDAAERLRISLGLTNIHVLFGRARAGQDVWKRLEELEDVPPEVHEHIALFLMGLAESFE